MQTPATDTDHDERTDAPSLVGRVETDRFCVGCGYNLHTQGVWRDPATQLLVCRCPECGRFDAVGGTVTAGQLWLHRIGLPLLFVWIIIVIGLPVGLLFGHGALVVETLEELTRYQPASTAPAPTTQMTLPSGQVIAYQANVPWTRQPRGDFPYRRLVIATLLVVAGQLGFCLVAWVAVVAHHWRRWGYWILASLPPLGVGGLVWYIWAHDFPLLRDWATPYVVGLTLANVVGGALGVYLGRPAMRLVLRLTLPPRIRQTLAFLWIADGKPPPHVPKP